MMRKRDKRMKWLFAGLGAALTLTAVAAGITALCRRSPEENTDHIDGGVIKQVQADVPKVIESTEIVEFHAEISLTTVYDADEQTHRVHKGVYKLDAVLENGEVLVKYDWYDHQGRGDRAEYKADADFLAKIQEIAAAYNFAKHNGYYHKVSGLPDMYGERLDIIYASGEQIYAYDNQSRFLPYEAAEELILLFGASIKSENQSS